MSLSTRHFTFVKDTKTFIADLTDLPRVTMPTRTGIRFGKHVEVLDLESHVTGDVLSFFLDKVVRDGDGCIAGYRFNLLHDRDIEKFGDLKILVLND